jgi:hypothetical protein
MRTLLSLLLLAALTLEAMPPPSGGTAVMPVVTPIATVNGGRGVSSLAVLCSQLQNGDQLEISPGTWTVTAYNQPSGMSPEGAEANFPFYLSRKTNITLTGFGTVLSWTNFGTPCFVYACSNITFRGITFRGGRQDVTNYLGGGLYALQSAVGMLGTNAVITFEDCTFESIPTHAITQSQGWCDGLTIQRCRWRSVGQTNVADLGNILDGACMAGFWKNVFVKDCSAYEVVRWFEWERGGATFPVHAGNIKLVNNTVTRIYECAVGIWTGGDGLNSVSDVGITGNYFRIRDGAEYQQLNGYGLVEFRGGTNLTIAHNSFIGGTNDGTTLVKLLQTAGTNICNVLIQGNQFHSLSNGPYCAIDIRQTAPYIIQGVKIEGNTFDSLGSGALWCDAPGVTFIGNNVRNWVPGGYAMRMANNSLASSNLLVMGNTFFSPSAGSFLLYVYANTFRDGIKWIDNLVIGPITAQAWTFATATQATNLLLRTWGTGSPQGAIAAGAGSQWFRTDTSTVGTMYVRTNTDGTANGWRAMP